MVNSAEPGSPFFAPPDPNAELSFELRTEAARLKPPLPREVVRRRERNQRLFTVGVDSGEVFPGNSGVIRDFLGYMATRRMPRTFMVGGAEGYLVGILAPWSLPPSSRWGAISLDLGYEHPLFLLKDGTMRATNKTYETPWMSRWDNHSFETHAPYSGLVTVTTEYSQNPDDDHSPPRESWTAIQLDLEALLPKLAATSTVKPQPLSPPTISS